MRVNLFLFFCVAHSVLGSNVINVWGKKKPSVVIGHWVYPCEGPPQQGMVFVFLFFPMGRVRHTQKQWSVIKISPKWILWEFQTAEQENGLKNRCESPSRIRILRILCIPQWFFISARKKNITADTRVEKVENKFLVWKWEREGGHQYLSVEKDNCFLFHGCK